jgi:hypothetical protein
MKETIGKVFQTEGKPLTSIRCEFEKEVLKMIMEASCRGCCAGSWDIAGAHLQMAPGRKAPDRRGGVRVLLQTRKRPEGCADKILDSK